jgi:hypothetical protein
MLSIEVEPNRYSITTIDNTPWLVNMQYATSAILDQKVQCLVTTDFIYR